MTEMPSGWHMVEDGEAWGRMPASLNGHPAQSVLRGVARRMAENIEALRLGYLENGKPLFLARVGITLSQNKGFELPAPEALMQQLMLVSKSDGAETKLFLARHNGRAGAGAFVIRCGLHAHCFWGVSDRDMSRLRIGEAVQWAGIEWAAAKGCTRYDLGGIHPVNNPGVSAFKKKMGGKEVRLPGKNAQPLNIKGSLIRLAGRLTGRV